jgi:hypothetical protein
MSKELMSQKMKQTCDACGATKEWELVGADENPTIISEMQEWYIVTRKVVINRQMTQLTADACSLACTPAAAVKLALPPQDDPADNIDLASLRSSNLTN